MIEKGQYRNISVALSRMNPLVTIPVRIIGGDYNEVKVVDKLDERLWSG